MFNPYSLQGGTATLDPQMVGMNGQSRMPELLGAGFGGTLGTTIPVGGVAFNPTMGVPANYAGFGYPVPQSIYGTMPFVGQPIQQPWQTYGVSPLTNPYSAFAHPAISSINPVLAQQAALYGTMPFVGQPIQQPWQTYGVSPLTNPYSAFAHPAISSINPVLAQQAALYGAGYPTTSFGVPSCQPTIGYPQTFGTPVSAVQPFVPGFHPFSTIPTNVLGASYAGGIVNPLVNPWANPFASPLVNSYVNPLVNPYVNPLVGGAVNTGTFPAFRNINSPFQTPAIPTPLGGIPFASPFSTPFSAALTGTPFVDPTLALSQSLGCQTNPFITNAYTNPLQHSSLSNPFVSHLANQYVGTPGLTNPFISNAIASQIQAMTWGGALTNPITRALAGVNPFANHWNSPIVNPYNSILNPWSTSPLASSQINPYFCNSQSCGFNPTSFGLNPFTGYSPISAMNGVSPWANGSHFTNPHAAASIQSPWLNPLVSPAALASTLHPSVWPISSALTSPTWCSPACLN